MRYIPHTEDDIRQMLRAIGVPSVESLFASIPKKLRLGRSLALPKAASEQEVLAELAALAVCNAHTESHDWFLGAGTYAHFVPSAVDALASRAEFYTSYTPYQPEISQGTLQTIFEWQTMICALTGLEVSNASMYDGASATAEAALMAMRLTRRHKIVAAGLHPHYRDVLRTYSAGPQGVVAEAPREASGRTASLAPLLDRETACVVLQQPSFLGVVEELQAAAEAAHAVGALLVVVVTEALSLALLRGPGELGADIVCGEAQSFGVPMSFGGPHLGFLATRSSFVRQMPGRVVGQTARRPRAARLRAHALHPGAAHPPRACDVEHLYQPGAHVATRDDLSRPARTSRPARARAHEPCQGGVPAGTRARNARSAAPDFCPGIQ